jgi:hypothetical protein
MNTSGVAVMSFATFASSARADTTIKSDDASVELTVPNGWRQTKTAAPAIQIQATNGRAIVLVRIAQKEDYKDLKSFAQFGSQRFLKKFTDAEPKTEDVQVNGKPAIRISAEGTQENGVRRGFVMTFLGMAAASAFKTEQQIMADMAGRVRILAAAGAAPGAQAPGNTRATPPAAQPPTGRQPR